MAAFFSEQSSASWTTEVGEAEMDEPSVDADKLSYEIFSILESKFLFGYEDEKNLWIPKSFREQQPAIDSNIVSAAMTPRAQRGKICILSIDGGGGLRGILAGKALLHLEQSLREKSGDPDARIADFFDIAAGAGVGGILTTLLFGTKDQSRPIFNADEATRFVTENAKRIYGGENGKKSGLLGKIFKSGSHGVSGFKKSIREVIGDLTLKDTIKPVLIPCYDMRSSAPFLFSRADALETDGYDFRLSQVCCATTAEPGIFDPVLMNSVDGQTHCLAVDGCLAMSNPTAAAITHVVHNKQGFPLVRGLEDLLVLSLGTEQLSEFSYEYEEIKGWKEKHWVRPMTRIANDCSSDGVHQAVALAFGHRRASNYVRIQANGMRVGRSGADMAEEMMNQKNVESVLFGGQKVGNLSNAAKLEWLADELVTESQRRRRRRNPTVAFKQAAVRDPPEAYLHE